MKNSGDSAQFNPTIRAPDTPNKEDMITKAAVNNSAHNQSVMRIHILANKSSGQASGTYSNLS